MIEIGTLLALAAAGSALGGVAWFFISAFRQLCATTARSGGYDEVINQLKAALLHRRWRRRGC